MGRTTAIEWTDATWNPWMGCHKVSAGCRECYMFREQEHYGNDPRVIRRSKTKFNVPLQWEKAMTATGAPPEGETLRVFICSWSDFFIEEADPWRNEAWEIIRKTPHLTYQILTKRPENIDTRLPDGWFPRNVWWGVSIESQDCLNRWDILDSALHYHVPPVMFVSAEPLLGPLDLSPILQEVDAGDEDCPWWTRAPDWIIGGGESGTNARPCHPDWARGLRDQCQVSGTPFFFKQWGEWLPYDHDPTSPMFGVRPDYYVDPDAGYSWWRVGKRKSGRMLDGREWNEFPGEGG